MRFCLRFLAAPAGLLAGTITTGAMAQGWVQFANETADRVVAAPGLSTTDPEEKDFGFGDLDKDGDIDLVVVRKTGFTVFGPKRNVLFMNEGVAEGLSKNGIFVDRTTEFASLADDGGQGFFDLTNDRNVSVIDVNNDSWLDVVTLTALGQSQTKTLSHPRVYINLGDDANGAWLGLKYESARIPTLQTAPNGCGIGVGDVTGDGRPDIYMVNYNQSMGDRLLINDGNGFFTDQTASRMTPAMFSVGFGTAGAIVDINNDGFNDLVKSENGPFKTTYNNPANPGFFIKQTTPSSGAHYNMSVGELNNDGKLDIVISDDGSDRYLLNDGTNPDGTTKFQSKTYSFQGGGGDDGIAGNSATADLNNDGWNDVVICDVDVDIPGCDRRAHIYRNLGNAPSVTLQEQGQVIPNTALKGMHDIAIFDINNDGWQDIILGKCTGLQIWVNQPPFGLVYSYPTGLPGFLMPGETTVLRAKLTPVGASEVIAGSEKIRISVEGGEFIETALTPVGDNEYEAVLPALACTESLAFKLVADLSTGGTFMDPAPADQFYTAIAALGTDITFRDELEGDVSGWGSFDGTGVGTWQQVDPNSTLLSGKLAAPEDDASSALDAFKAFVTLNGEPLQPANVSDVDGGPFALVAPVVSVKGGDAILSFSAWFFCDDKGTAEADVLHVELNNGDRNGWQPAFDIADTASAWKNFSFLISDYVTPTDEVRVRFLVKDIPNNSVTEAGIDNFQVEEYICPTQVECAGDLDSTGEIDGADLGLLLAAWGTPDTNADLDGNGDVDGADLGLLLSGWGACP